MSDSNENRKQNLKTSLSILAKLFDEIVVFLVSADPKPDNEIVAATRECAIINSNSN